MDKALKRNQENQNKTLPTPNKNKEPERELTVQDSVSENEEQLEE